MSIGLSDRVRAFAKSRYVASALQDGRQQFSIRVKDILVEQRVPLRNTPQVCDALMGRRFLRDNDLEIEGVDGPPSNRSSTVVVHYRMARPDPGPGSAHPASVQAGPAPPEDPSVRAARLTGRLSGILKDELGEFGGSEAFLCWVRSQKDAAV